MRFARTLNIIALAILGAVVLATTVAPGEAGILLVGRIFATCSGKCAETWLVTCADPRTHSINGATTFSSPCYEIIAVGYAPASVLGQTDHEYANVFPFRFASVIRPATTHGITKALMVILSACHTNDGVDYEVKVTCNDVNGVEVNNPTAVRKEND